MCTLIYIDSPHSKLHSLICSAVFLETLRYQKLSHRTTRQSQEVKCRNTSLSYSWMPKVKLKTTHTHTYTRNTPFSEGCLPQTHQNPHPLLNQSSLSQFTNPLLLAKNEGKPISFQLDVSLPTRETAWLNPKWHTLHSTLIIFPTTKNRMNLYLKQVPAIRTLTTHASQLQAFLTKHTEWRRGFGTP